MRRIESSRPPAAAYKPARTPTALTGLAGNALAIALLAALSYAVNLTGHYAEARGWSLRDAQILEASLAGGGAALFALMWWLTTRTRVVASWLCLGLIVRAGCSIWILLRIRFPGL